MVVEGDAPVLKDNAFKKGVDAQMGLVAAKEANKAMKVD